MRKYLFGTGLIGAITSGFTLLRSAREETFTWRTVIAWLSWGLSLALAIGSIAEVRRDTKTAALEADPLADLPKQAARPRRR